MIRLPPARPQLSRLMRRLPASIRGLRSTREVNFRRDLNSPISRAVRNFPMGRHRRLATVRLLPITTEFLLV